MSEKPRAKAGATPAKLALVGLLIVVLIGVIASNFGGSSPSNETLAAEAPATGGSNAPIASATVTTAASVAANTVNPFGDFAADSAWPDPTLKEVAKYDPFAPAAWAAPANPEPKVDESVSEKQIEELLSSKDAIIFMSGDKRVARIGKQEFRVGDVIGRYTISEITSQGVVLSEGQ